ncbi:MAG TPA: DUF72 domain-containing protein [Candidatus Elarobacter sp.]|nr:DUF72 domain-containing protein [Candidatus Elarobacter sp.]
MPPALRIGTQGWNYQAWLGGFYPDGTRAGDFLSVYARAFDTVEVDSTFYAVPAVSTLRGWYDRTPPGFVFALKFPQAVTHEARLRDVDGTTATFFERARELRDKLGPILVQLGPDFGPEELPALVEFLPSVPRDLRVAIEFRVRAWMTPGVLALLRDHGIAVALVDGSWVPRRWMIELASRPTATFHYIRWMGPNRNLVDHSRIQVDRSRELALWSEAILDLPDSVTEVYGYTSNYYAGHAPRTARDIQEMLGMRTVDPDMLGDQMRLF